MRYFKQIAMIAFGLSLVRAGFGETIPLTDLPLSPAASDATAVHITPTGPEPLPLIQGELQILGIAPPIANAESQYYSATATLDRPAKMLTLDVRRGNNSGWDNPITLTAFDNGHVVDTTTVELPPLGETAHVSVSAPAIDQISWSGTGWVFHPYFLRDLQVAFASSPSVTSPGPGSVATPSVGTSVPEPSGIWLLVAVGGLVLARRRRRRV